MGHSSMNTAFHELRRWNEGRLFETDQTQLASVVRRHSSNSGYPRDGNATVRTISSEVVMQPLALLHRKLSWPSGEVGGYRQEMHQTPRAYPLEPVGIAGVDGN